MYLYNPFFLSFSYIRNEAPPDSDHLDSEGEALTARKRKMSKAALEKQKAAAKKKAKKCDGDDDEYDDDRDEYTAPSKSLRTNKSGDSRPPNGSFAKCAKCSKQFTMVRSFGRFVACIVPMIVEDQLHDGR